MGTADGDVRAFLAEHTPFQSMPSEELDRMVRGTRVEEFAAGTVVADYTGRIPDDVWMVFDGQVTLHASADGAVIDTVGPGGVFGYTPMLVGGGMQFEARTALPSRLIRLPGGLVRSQFASPAGLAFLASSAWNATTAPRPSDTSGGQPVGELVDGEVLLVDPRTTVREAVIQMAHRQVSYALIRLPDGGLGIFTDRDLRTRIVAAGIPVDVEISRVMSAPARTVTADLTSETVLMEMLESGVRHMPVLTGRGDVIGVLEDAHLLAASTRQSFILRRSIGSAADARELQRVGHRVRGIAGEQFRNGTKASATSAMLSVVVDSLVRRALEIAVVESGAGSEDFAWLTLGSVARREAMPSSDVDSALSWRDELSSDAAELRAIAQRTHDILDGCGLPSDRNGAIATKAGFSRPASQWRTAAQGWLDHPLRDRGLMMSSLLIDARVVWGDTALHTAAAAYRRPRDHPEALRLQLLDALSGRVRTRSLRDVLARRGGTFDLKSHAVTPIVNLARWGGLTAGLTTATTPARLAAAAQARAISAQDATTLSDVYLMLQRLRMTHQVEQLDAGHTPGDVITMSELSPLNRSLLNEGLREIAAVQRRVRQSGIPPV
ncbi:putative nucleotidyltransferase substrate binding domain-containing protein [Mycolicibacterium baixiangningiae]|uniref:putative nucleotidyltransferase substrate binding domain-containing protein n=1 Tax=Mycolicibacterium baixiangningiae TaxID=2761578 RepID=UPI001868D695|nr:putative nucleotidyltransferase substrate binding domain-containing protein [Mycolicibacterium baixiangningiae]